MGAIWDGFKEALAYALAFFYDVIPSYGIAIILLTVTINLLLFPLTLRQTRATRAFQAVQPEIRRIQKQYKEEPEKLQQELMRVQREAGATPGGCIVPLLVQMPILLALFQLLNDPAKYLPAESALASEFSTATFLGMDLGTSPSQAFQQGFVVFLPYLLMLLLMVGTQYVQQWHAQPPTSPDAPAPAQTQQAITRILPLFIGFVSWNFPAGVVLYWATSNLFRLGQQLVIFRIDGRPTAPGATPAKAANPPPEGAPPNGPTAETKGDAPVQKSNRPQGSARKRNRRRRG
jgi:YidC/Oxa1 family membrane protein insertase